MKYTFLLLTLASCLCLQSPAYLCSEQTSLPPSLLRLQHQIHNLETEISCLKQKIENQEATVESQRAEISALIKATKELNAKSHDTQDAKLTKLEKSIEKLVADMQQFKTHANATTDTVAQIQKTLREQEEESRFKSERLQELEAACKSLAKALQNKISQAKDAIGTLVDDKVSNVYRVRSGDTLDKIAKENRTSARAIREENGLSSDKITVGQNLKIP